MLSKITFAKRYSKALFDLLKSDHELDSGYKELTQVRDVIKSTPQLLAALNSVSFPEADKEKLVEPLVNNVSIKYVKNLIKVVFECGRMSNMVTLIDQFEHLYDQDHKIVHAELITAVKVDDQQIEALKKAFAERTGANQVIFNCKVDQGIIGGVVIKSSNVIIDGSVKTRISRVRQLLLS
ncbi:ATP synthase F1 subunit delta [Acetilactobacillus jinshanensis]|uniref:ATP synthase subunit delta n=1 Tax=Acetilactobacillus jinshanensis TaxID=1720083 RepID=A0A4P6ZLS4_9LACO|nr:ATP synthase F1 subunit delta [Acetilactobacillus jinshanensis]QBP18776.1 F0F1 ATP synthase subunit delta [Acetilactobacillus jinshanensis]URL61646.1 F0F1 ATP synthase subunit delta [uncultured bacterium]